MKFYVNYAKLKVISWHFLSFRTNKRDETGRKKQIYLPRISSRKMAEKKGQKTKYHGSDWRTELELRFSVSGSRYWNEPKLPWTLGLRRAIFPVSISSKYLKPQHPSCLYRHGPDCIRAIWSCLHVFHEVWKTHCGTRHHYGDHNWGYSIGKSIICLEFILYSSELLQGGMRWVDK